MGIAKLWRSAENARSCDDAVKLKHQFSKDDFLANFNFKSRSVKKHGVEISVNSVRFRKTTWDTEYNSVDHETQQGK